MRHSGRLLSAALALLLAGALVLLAGRSGAFDPAAPEGMLAQPCLPADPPPQSATAKLKQAFLLRLRGDRDRRLLRDWAELCHYREANAALIASGTRPRVVVIGDSIAGRWQEQDGGFFTGGIVNRGIGGQTSGQMLLRFQQDVIALRPRAVHIVAGLNDIAGLAGPARPQDFQNNIRAMVTLAEANGIAVVLASMTPVRQDSHEGRNRPAARIAELNRWLSEFAAARGTGFADYSAALTGPAGEPASGQLESDGIHLTKPAYAIMRPIAEAAFAEAAPAEAAPAEGAQEDASQEDNAR